MRPTSLKLTSKGLSIFMVFALLSTPVMVSPVFAAPGDLTRVSVDSAGAQANGASRRDEMSGDGRFVVFESDATNLAGGTGGLFLKDRQTGAVTRVGVDGTHASISNDGRFISFNSTATNEVIGDTNGVSDVFVFDRQGGVVTRVSVDSSGVQSNANSDRGTAISGDGRYVVFPSEATNLVSGDTNNVRDIFVYDRQTGQPRRVSVASSGAEANGSSDGVDISADGRYVTFHSTATNLVTGDTNGKADVFVYDLQTGSTIRVSVNTSGAEATGGGFDPAISGDGRYVVFMSASGNLDPRADEYSGKDLVYLHDRQSGQTTLLSVASDGSILTVGLFDQPTISNNGRYVAFSFYDKGNNNGILHIWVRDLQTGESRQVVGGNASASSASLSADGKFVAFASAASLGSGDTNGVSDIFVYELAFGPERNPTVAATAPDCGFSRPLCTYPTNASVSFMVLFSEPVSGVTADDFTLDMLEGISGASITGISGSGVQYIVTINTGTGDGRLRLNVVDNDSIVDTALNPLGGVGAGNGNFSKFAGFLYIVDKNSPAVTNIVRADPNPTTATDVRFTVSFSEFVYPVNAGDFVLSTTGGISGATITAIDPREDQFTAAATYTVTVNTGTGDGTLRLDLIDDDSILDNNLGNPLGGAGAGNGSFTTGESYTINRNTPLVTSSLRAGANPTEAASVNFTVNFSQAVTGVDQSDFALTATGGMSGVLVTNVSGSGSAYTVTVSTGSGNGDLRLDIVDNDSILNVPSFPLGGAGTGNGSFTSGESYTILRSNPIVNSITRMDTNPSSAQTVNFRLTFSEPVNGVDISDFAVNVSGISGASLIAVNGSGNSYAVTVGTGTGNGSLRLDLLDNDSIVDLANNPLGGVGTGNGNSNSETYTINKVTVTYSSVTFRSNGSNDGWVLESNENSNVGGTINAIDPTFRLGDSAKDQQYKVILHFPTEGLPDNAVITSAILTMKRKGVTGTNPFTTHGNIVIDIATGNFGFDSYLGSYALQPLDFQAPSTLNNVGTIQNNPVGDVYWSLLSGDGNRFVNLKGVTQLRLAFQLDDNDDLGEDLIHFFSGDAKQLLDRPHLQIEYYVTR